MMKSTCSKSSAICTMIWRRNASMFFAVSTLKWLVAMLVASMISGVSSDSQPG